MEPNFKKDTNELIDKTETHTDIENKLMGYQRGHAGGRDKSRAWGEHVHITIYDREATRTYCIAQGTLLSIL